MNFVAHLFSFIAIILQSAVAFGYVFPTSPTRMPASVALNVNGPSLGLAEFAADINRLSQLRPPNPSDDFSSPTRLISDGSSYTRMWSSATWKSHQRPPLSRYWRHVKRWNASSTARQILPAVFVSAMYSLVTTYLLRHSNLVQYPLESLTKGGSAAMAALTGPLALLLTLRSNASLGRLNEARMLYGGLFLRCRSLLSLFAVYVFPNHEAAAVCAARYISVLGWSLKSFVRDEDPEKEQEVYRVMLPEAEAEWLMKQSKRPMAIATRIRQLISQISATNTPGTFLVQHQSMESAIYDIEGFIAGCERLVSSPIPPTYSRHLSRIMVMYLAILPIALVASGVPTLGSTFCSAFVSYVLIGIDNIGIEIENPFPILPLQQISAAVQNSAKEIMQTTKLQFVDGSPDMITSTVE